MHVHFRDFPKKIGSTRTRRLQLANLESFLPCPFPAQARRFNIYQSYDYSTSVYDYSIHSPTTNDNTRQHTHTYTGMTTDHLWIIFSLLFVNL